MTAPVHPLPPLHGFETPERARYAATTPPPVRVVRLAGDDAEIRWPAPLAFAAEAARRGSVAVEFATRPERPEAPHDHERFARIHATRAAHFARLALGASR